MGWDKNATYEFPHNATAEIKLSHSTIAKYKKLLHPIKLYMSGFKFVSFGLELRFAKGGEGQSAVSTLS
jgi:hypothetical protein